MVRVIKPSVVGAFNFMEHWKNLSLENIVEEIDGIVYTEEWKPVVGYEKLYMVSSFGRVKSLGCYNHPEKIKNQRFPKNGYLLVSIWENNKEKKLLVHRMVAKAFIPNPDNKKTVNHKQGNKKDNRWLKLEWNTRQENTIHSYRELGRKSNPLRGANHSRAKKVIQKDKNGDIINKYDTVTEAAFINKIGISHIARVCRGVEKSAHGFKWEYA